MASITIIPLGHDEIEISCGEESVRVVVAADKDSGEPAKEPGGKDKDSGGGTTTPPGGDTKPGPIFYPPTHIPLFARQAIGELSHVSFARLASTDGLESLVAKFKSSFSDVHDREPRHLVVMMPQRRIDIHELTRKFAYLEADAQVTVLLASDHV
jgi:hypothetical protein